MTILLVLTVYRAHIFVSSGTFTVTRLPTNPEISSTIEYLVVGGGGGGGGGSSGGNAGTGGGGAGGVIYPSVHQLLELIFPYQLHIQFLLDQLLMRLLLVLVVLVDLPSMTHPTQVYLDQ